MKKLLLSLFIVCCATPAYAQDIVTLNNGQQLAGEVLSHNARLVNIQAGDSVYRVPMSRISGFASDNSRLEQRVKRAIDIAAMNGTEAALIFEAPQIKPYTPSPPPVTPQSQEFEEATIQPAEMPAPAMMKVRTVAPASATTAATLTETPKKILGAEWSGNVNLGAGLRSGNSETNNVNADAAVEAKWNKQHRTSFEADYNREEEDSTVSVDDRSAGLKHDYFFAEKWFLQGAAKFEQDDIAQLDLRTLFSAGLGYQPYDRDDLSLQFVAGPGYQNEEFEDGTEDNSMTAQWALDYTQKFYDDLFRLFHNHDLSAPTEDFDAWLFQSKSGIRVPLRQGIVASGQVDFDWDNAPPAGTTEDDTTYTVKLGYEW